jgi:hypothetical protein
MQLRNCSDVFNQKVTEMKTRYILLFIVVILISLDSCLDFNNCITSNGIPLTVRRRTEMFNKIENSTSIDVVFKRSDSTSVTIKADENIIDYIITETYKNTLEIKIRNDYNCLDLKESPLITVTSPNLESVSVTGSGNLIADNISGSGTVVRMTGSGDISVNTLTSPFLYASITGSGNINIDNCHTEDSEIMLSGSGNISMSGEGDDCKLSVTGSGRVFNEKMLLRAATVSISGSGNSFINISTSLNAIITGSGNIYLKGNPAISQNITGSGRIIRYK